ncbi:hypothetical protein [Streptomyces flavofungini]|uniref:hypothetical protein n=1 Tax=Streptomyces flavofungini TaxID=68200 RepID=UPI0025B24AAE|nr:hypothetical protein [Streptomyces flavofungini]WJV51720.1 hypothetical protein QUY26_40385 [Streptomyces flavofungini]
MHRTSCQTFTVMGLRLDVDLGDIFIAGVVPGPIADEVIILSTSEEELTRWAMDVDAPDADTAARLARQHCRTEADTGEQECSW